ncbi:MAG TPA: hypothetical protein DIT39_02470 [Tissierellales bacterium]|nr:hypothetical protein [Tissierellales bacterium]
MSTYEAIGEVGNTLKRLILNNISSINQFKDIGENGITLSSPEEDNNSQLSIFLYNIVEDSYQRNQGMLPVNSRNLKKTPTTLRLFYMITPHLDKSMKDKEHILIGKIIQIFSDNPVLRSPFLEGPLTGETLKLIPNTLSIDEINKFWSIVSKSKPYMLSIYYEVSPIRIDSTRKVETIRVASVDLESKIGAV